MTSTSAFRLLSAPSGTYNKAPSGIVAAGLPAFTRGALGAFSLPGAEDARRPPKPPALYEFQACPFCKKAREAATLLALDLVFYPCPKSGTAFRPLAAEMASAAGKARPQFPLLVEEGEAPLLFQSKKGRAATPRVLVSPVSSSQRFQRFMTRSYLVIPVTGS